ncbi:Acetyltransferase (GNAT) family protein [Rhizobium sp. RU20A]|uniref:GNAT family N-acetyltransferase n=1 Tax=Rhizobium sp. RU20A TaxID=1907412 RepID=UPI0009571EA2|nr:GNAT family N-acetyltransferase [Rhizobium sp. RU20A]SIP98597.1 Acetyltransferase (GNAT) family protein [Rhizobium sp. RU20A]
MSPASPLLIRPARRGDLRDIISLFADDPLGGHGDTLAPDAFPAYLAAFERIASTPTEALYVAEEAGEVVGTFQTTLTTSLTGRGRTTMILEAVQVRADRRGRQIGEAMVREAERLALAAGAATLKLTSNMAREGAHRFYERLGFDRSHYGFKRTLK